MNVRSRSAHLSISLVVGLGLLVAVLAASVAPVTAQDGGAWLPPSNLSQSGAATNPVTFREATGTTHVVWQDESAGFMYTLNQSDLTDPTAWSPPLAVTVPFTDAMPKFADGLEGEILAFWIGPAETLVTGQDEQGQSFSQVGAEYESALQQSRVASEQFASFPNWTTPLRLADAVVAFDVIKGSDGRLHLSYVGSTEEGSATAGVYYLYSDDAGRNWSEAVLIYESAYLRPLVSDTGHVRMALSEVGNQESIFVAWDNPALEKVWVTRSPDAGATWETATEIDRRDEDDAPAVAGPGGIELSADGQNVVLVWRSGHGEVSCGIYYSYSSNAGSRWRAPQRVALGTPRCPEEHALLGRIEGQELLLFNDGATASLLAWNGSDWSEPQEQDQIYSFVRPDTFREATLGCYQWLLTGDELTMIGCSKDELGDVWLTQRQLSGLISWFEPPSPWQAPQVLDVNAAPVLSFALADDRDGRHSLIWSRSGSGDLYYSRGREDRWFTPQAILTTPGGDIGRVALATVRGDRLIAVWQDTATGIFYAQADINQAVFAAKWSLPQQLPGSAASGASVPAVAADLMGNVYVAYSVPLNNSRGIYLMASEDGAQSWKEPVLLFDGEAAGWQVVGPPQLAVTADGVIHLMWDRQVLTPDGGSAVDAVFYGRSVDGQALSDVEMVATGAIQWSALKSFGEHGVHRMVLRTLSGGSEFAHDGSVDSGATWEALPRASNLGGQLAVAMDVSGQLQLFQLTASGLQRWVFEEGRWLALERLNGDLGATAALAGSAGTSMVVVFTQANAEGEALAETARFYRVAATPMVEPTAPVAAAPEPAVEPTQAPTSVATATPTPRPEPTRSLAAAAPAQNPLPLVGGLASDTPTGRILASLIPAALIVLFLVLGSVLVVRVIERVTGRRR